MQRQAAEANAAAATAAAAYGPGGVPMAVGNPFAQYGVPVPGVDTAHPAAAPVAASGPAGGDRIEQLERLAGLHERGVLTDEEFAAEKRRILGG
jgi:hypothetical protein